MGPLLLGRQFQIKLSLSTLHVPSAKFKLSVALHRDGAADLSKTSSVSSSRHITDKIFMVRLQNQNLLGVGGVAVFPSQSREQSY